MQKQWTLPNHTLPRKLTCQLLQVASQAPVSLLHWETRKPMCTVQHRPWGCTTTIATSKECHNDQNNANSSYGSPSAKIPPCWKGKQTVYTPIDDLQCPKRKQTESELVQVLAETQMKQNARYRKQATPQEEVAHAIPFTIVNATCTMPCLIEHRWPVAEWRCNVMICCPKRFVPFDQIFKNIWLTLVKNGALSNP